MTFHTRVFTDKMNPICFVCANNSDCMAIRTILQIKEITSLGTKCSAINLETFLEREEQEREGVSDEKDTIVLVFSNLEEFDFGDRTRLMNVLDAYDGTMFRWQNCQKGNQCQLVFSNDPFSKEFMKKKHFLSPNMKAYDQDTIQNIILSIGDFLTTDQPKI